MANDERLDQLLEEIQRLSKEVNACKSEIENLRIKVDSPSFTVNHADDNAALSSFRNGANAKTLENFIGLKLIHFVGIIVLLIGLSFGVKYAIDVNLVSPLVRIILTYLVSVALLFVSFAVGLGFEGFVIGGEALSLSSSKSFVACCGLGDFASATS